MLRREDQLQGLSPCQLSLWEKKTDNEPGVLTEDGQVRWTESWGCWGVC